MITKDELDQWAERELAKLEAAAEQQKKDLRKSWEEAFEREATKWNEAERLEQKRKWEEKAKREADRIKRISVDRIIIACEISCQRGTYNENNVSDIIKLLEDNIKNSLTPPAVVAAIVPQMG